MLLDAGNKPVLKYSILQQIYMNTTTSVSITNNYWNILKHLSDDIKIDLITLLSTSLKNKAHKSVSASDFYGSWGNDNIGTEEFVRELRESRKFSHEIVEM